MLTLWCARVVRGGGGWRGITARYKALKPRCAPASNAFPNTLACFRRSVKVPFPRQQNHERIPFIHSVWEYINRESAVAIKTKHPLWNTDSTGRNGARSLMWGSLWITTHTLAWHNTQYRQSEGEIWQRCDDDFALVCARSVFHCVIANLLLSLFAPPEAHRGRSAAMYLEWISGVSIHQLWVRDAHQRQAARRCRKCYWGHKQQYNVLLNRCTEINRCIEIVNRPKVLGGGH